MNYAQHRNHIADGTYPWPGCQLCYQFIIAPAMRAYRGDYGELKSKAFVDLDGIDLDQLAADVLAEAA